MAVKNTPKNGTPTGRFSLTLSGRGMAAVVVLFIICLGWTFVLGVLVGRGYKPEEAVPKLAELMPEAQQNASAPAAEADPEVLKPEELEFFEELQKKPGQVSGEVSPPEQEANAPEPAPKPALQAQPAAKQEQSGNFMYIYQAAAYRSVKQAEEFRAKIQAKGYSAGVESATYGGNTWHRVLVHFKGSPEETRVLKETLRGLGVEKPLLRGKKPL